MVQKLIFHHELIENRESRIEFQEIEKKIDFLKTDLI